MQVEEPTIAARIHQLQVNIDKLVALKKHKIKSKVQSYDIRDCEEYHGILELESLLRKSSQEQKLAHMVDLRRRSGSFNNMSNNIVASRVLPDREEESSSSSHVESEVQESHEYEDDKPINTLQLNNPNLQTISYPDPLPANQSQISHEESPRLVNRRTRHPSKL